MGTDGGISKIVRFAWGCNEGVKPHIGSCWRLNLWAGNVLAHKFGLIYVFMAKPPQLDSRFSRCLLSSCTGLSPSHFLMGFNFRKSVKLGPIQFNVSKSDIGVSAGLNYARAPRRTRGAPASTSARAASTTVGSSADRASGPSSRRAVETGGAGLAVKNCFQLATRN